MSVDTMQQDEAWRDALRNHFPLVGRLALGRSIVACSCGEFRSEPQPDTGAAAERWIEHVQEVVDAS